MSDVYEWALKAEPGEVKVYHVGPNDLNYCHPEVKVKQAEAFAAARRAYDAGLAILFQRRIRDGHDAGQLQYEALKVSDRVAGLLGLPGASLSYRRVA